MEALGFFLMIFSLPFVISEQLHPQNLGMAQCNCPIKHPQEKICRADIVIKGRVDAVKSSSFGSPGMGGLLEYTVKVMKEFKGSDSGMVTRGNKVNMITSSSPGKCGVTQMEIGELYLLTGLVIDGEVFFSVCEWVQKYKDLTPDQRVGLREPYLVGCESCLIDQRDDSIPGIHGDNTSSTNNICYHDPLGSANLLIEDCESMFTKCVPMNENQCAWTLSKRYNKCVDKRFKKHKAKQV